MEDLPIIKQSSLKRQDPPSPPPSNQGESRKDPTTGEKMRKMNLLESN